MAPGAKFSTMTSARFAMFLTSLSPCSDFRLTVMDFLLALNNRKYQESWPWQLEDARSEKRPASPPCGFSTLTTSAPSQASASVQEGPASNWVRSRTRTPARQPGSAPSLPISSFLLLVRVQHEWKSAYGVATLRNSGRSVTVRSAQLKQRGIASFGPKTVERSFLRQSGLEQAIDNDRWGRRL